MKHGETIEITPKDEEYEAIFTRRQTERFNTWCASNLLPSEQESGYADACKAFKEEGKLKIYQPGSDTRKFLEIRRDSGAVFYRHGHGSPTVYSERPQWRICRDWHRTILDKKDWL